MPSGTRGMFEHKESPSPPRGEGAGVRGRLSPKCRTLKSRRPEHVGRLGFIHLRCNFCVPLTLTLSPKGGEGIIGWRLRRRKPRIHVRKAAAAIAAAVI